MFLRGVSCRVPVVNAQSSVVAARPFCTVACRTRRFHKLLPLQASADVEQKTESVRPIENLDSSYCDDFECTSSPAVEQTVRALAKDLEQLKYTAGRFDRDCVYDDGFRQCSGPVGVARQQWVKASVKNPEVSIKHMQMIDKSTAQVDWRLNGELNGKAVDISYTVEVTINVLTGRITALKESWDLTKCDAATALVASGSRVAYAAKKASEDVGDGLKKIGETIDESFSTFDDSNNMTQDPNDPTKYFQEGGNNQDYINFALFVAVMYLVFQGFSLTASL
eukprot:gene32718-3603_t